MTTSQAENNQVSIRILHDEDDIDIGKIFGKIWSRKRTVLIVWLLVLFTGLGSTLIMDEEWVSDTVIKHPDDRSVATLLNANRLLNPEDLLYINVLFTNLVQEINHLHGLHTVRYGRDKMIIKDIPGARIISYTSTTAAGAKEGIKSLLDLANSEMLRKESERLRIQNDFETNELKIIAKSKNNTVPNIEGRIVLHENLDMETKNSRAFEVLEELPPQKKSSRKKMVLFTSAFLGLVLGCLLALILSSREGKKSA